jgi:hypothetical protein
MLTKFFHFFELDKISRARVNKSLIKFCNGVKLSPILN